MKLLGKILNVVVPFGFFVCGFLFASGALLFCAGCLLLCLILNVIQKHCEA